jgi:predicted PurR-regulated permease PerM
MDSIEPAEPPPLPAIAAPESEDLDTVRVQLSPSNIWRITLVILSAIALALLLRFILTDGGSLIFTLIMSWFLSLAMEPAVRKLSQWMRRWQATLVVMVSAAISIVVFGLLFGQLFVDQVAQMLRALPEVLTALIDWVNKRLGTSYQPSDVLASLNITPSQAAEYAGGVLGGVLGVVGTVVGAVFGTFTLAMFTYYFSADSPRLRHWLSLLLPSRYRPFFEYVYDLSVIKTGGYVAARVTLATINSTASSICFLVIGMPSWLALGIWTGVVAQFIPTIGTYISIALPVLVGLMSPDPWIGVAALIFGIAYQQVENLTIEPRISGKAVDIHPGVSFGAVILGAALFGVGGALLAIPIVAMLLAVVDTYVTSRREVAAAEPGPEPAARPAGQKSAKRRRWAARRRVSPRGPGKDPADDAESRVEARPTAAAADTNP